MERLADRRGARRVLGLMGRLVIIVAASVLSQGNGCSNLINPTKTQTGFQQCATINALYCNSYSIPQTLSDSVPGACCVVGDAPNAGVGYLCAFGANYQAAGCVTTLELARQICPNAVSIVRCTR